VPARHSPRPSTAAHARPGLAVLGAALLILPDRVAAAVVSTGGAGPYATSSRATCWRWPGRPTTSSAVPGWWSSRSPSGTCGGALGRAVEWLVSSHGQAHPPVCRVLAVAAGKVRGDRCAASEARVRGRGVRGRGSEGGGVRGARSRRRGVRERRRRTDSAAGSARCRGRSPAVRSGVGRAPAWRPCCQQHSVTGGAAHRGGRTLRLTATAAHPAQHHVRVVSCTSTRSLSSHGSDSSGRSRRQRDQLPVKVRSRWRVARPSAPTSPVGVEEGGVAFGSGTVRRRPACSANSWIRQPDVFPQLRVRKWRRTATGARAPLLAHEQHRVYGETDQVRRRPAGRGKCWLRSGRRCPVADLIVFSDMRGTVTRDQVGVPAGPCARRRKADSVSVCRRLTQLLASPGSEAKST